MTNPALDKIAYGLKAISDNVPFAFLERYQITPSVNHQNNIKRVCFEIEETIEQLRTALSNAPEQMDEMDITRAVLNIMRQSDKPETLCRKLVEWLRFHPNGLKITAAPNGGG